MGSSSQLDDHITRKYEIKKRIGKGAYGIVWKAIERSTNQTVAIKKIFDAFLNETDAQRTFREIMFLKEFRNHANIVRLLDIHRASNDEDIYLIFEYMDTDLHKLISKSGFLRDLHKRYIMYQLLRATYYIHSGNVIHRDQKPSNILVNSACCCKIADFGLARSLSSPRPGPGDVTDPALTDYVATRWYRAPEILVASQQYTKGIDMWSLGCILAEMLLGRPLFPGSSTVNQVERIMSAIDPPSVADLDSVAACYGSTLLSRAPTRPRVPLAEILRGAPVDAVDLVTRLLVLNPHKRLTAEQALAHPYVARYWQFAHEPNLSHDVVPLLSDHVQLSAAEYREKLYQLMRSQGGSGDAIRARSCVRSASTSNTTRHRHGQRHGHRSSDQSVTASKMAAPRPSTADCRGDAAVAPSAVAHKAGKRLPKAPGPPRVVQTRVTTSDPVVPRMASCCEMSDVGTSGRHFRGHAEGRELIPNHEYRMLCRSFSIASK